MIPDPDWQIVGEVDASDWRGWGFITKARRRPEALPLCTDSLLELPCQGCNDAGGREDGFRLSSLFLPPLELSGESIVLGISGTGTKRQDQVKISEKEGPSAWWEFSHLAEPMYSSILWSNHTRKGSFAPSR